MWRHTGLYLNPWRTRGGEEGASLNCPSECRDLREEEMKQNWKPGFEVHLKDRRNQEAKVVISSVLRLFGKDRGFMACQVYLSKAFELKRE